MASLADPKTLLRRYPAIDPVERAALVAWVRALRPGKLVALLAEGATERKLLELRANEPELVADGRHLTDAMFLATAAGTIALVASAFSLFVL